MPLISVIPLSSPSPIQFFLFFLRTEITLKIFKLIHPLQVQYIFWLAELYLFASLYSFLQMCSWKHLLSYLAVKNIPYFKQKMVCTKT